MSETRYLVLENGAVFKGNAFGAHGEITGEVVFTTGMTGYLETLTDPSYHGQIVLQTFPLIGNYGVIPPDFESGFPRPAGYIVKQWCPTPSNFRCGGNIDALLKEHGVVGLCGIDTRALTRIIREAGTMNGTIASDPRRADPDALKGFRVKRPVDAVTPRERTSFGDGNGPLVALWDFGCKESIRRELLARGCRIVNLPGTTKAEEILALSPDGLMLSNGPGDPTVNTEIIDELRKLIPRKIPTFGICLGHQLLALAAGARSEKLRFGHRGSNHPVRYTDSGRVYITSQNHGYALVDGSLGKGVAVMSCSSANDGTCEGLDYVSMPAFTVQFHPEASAGPRDTAFLFEKFMAMMEENGHAAV